MLNWGLEGFSKGVFGNVDGGFDGVWGFIFEGFGDGILFWECDCGGIVVGCWKVCIGLGLFRGFVFFGGIIFNEDIIGWVFGMGVVEWSSFKELVGGIFVIL